MPVALVQCEAKRAEGQGSEPQHCTLVSSDQVRARLGRLKMKKGSGKGRKEMEYMGLDMGRAVGWP